MSNLLQRKSEMGVSIAGSYWKILKFVERPNDLYMIFAIPRVGLHLSVHRGNRYNPSIHAHVKSTTLGIEEDIDIGAFSDLSLKQWIDEFSSIFKVQKLLDDERVIVLPTSFLTPYCLDFEEENRKSVINLENLLNGTFYLTHGRKIPLLQQYLRKTNIISNSDSLIAAGDSGQAYLTLGSKHVLTFECQSLLQKLNTCLGSTIADPLQRAFESVTQRCPNALREWWPSNFPDSIQNALNTAQFKIIDF